MPVIGQDVASRTSKYPNNLVEANHGVSKQLIHPIDGSQTMKALYETIKDFEILYMKCRGHYFV